MTACAAVDKISPDKFDDLQLHEQLVAYLDNELDEETSHNVEQMMASNPTVREQILQLQRAWDLLDDLPRAEADERFATSTVELIAGDIQAELDREQREAPLRQRRTWLIWGAGFALAGFLGVLATDFLWPERDAELLRDYAVVQKLDAFRQAGSITFLESLKERELFLQAEPSHGP